MLTDIRMDLENYRVFDYSWFSPIENSLTLAYENKKECIMYV